MSLNWSWKEKVGEAVIEQTFEGETREFTKSLYQGNVMLIFITEWKEAGVDKYSLYTFFADKNHMNILLGLKKDYEGNYNNIFKDGYDRLTKIRINKKKSRYTKDIVSALVKAFDDITIEIYSED